MDNNNSQSFADLWSSVCLLRAATAILRPSEHYCMPEMPQKAVPEKADLFTFASWLVSLLIKLSIGSENWALSLCA